MRSVAVLPFRSDSAQQYFADGIADAVINALARLGNVKVISRTSSFGFRNRTVDVRAIAESLGVAKIVEGSVQRVGDRVRVTANLTDAKSRATEWSQRFDNTVANVFEMEDSVAQAIADRVGGRASTVQRQISKTSVEANDHYLRGKDLLYRRDPASLLAAREEFRRAIRADARYSPAWAGLSHSYSLYLVIREGPLASKETSPDSTYGLAARALAAANRAIALDSTLPEAWGVRGYLDLYASAPFADGERDLREAIRLRRGYAEASGWLGQLIAYHGGPAGEAMALAAKGVELDPASIGMRLGYTGAAWATRDYVTALENARAVQILRPEFEPITSLYESPALAALGRAEECLRLARRPSLRPYCLVGAERRGEAEALVDSLSADWERGSSASYGMIHISNYYGMTGQANQYLKWVTRSYERIPIGVGFGNFGGLSDPVFRAEGGRARAAIESLQQAAWDRIVRESRLAVLP